MQEVLRLQEQSKRVLPHSSTMFRVRFDRDHEAWQSCVCHSMTPGPCQDRSPTPPRTCTRCTRALPLLPLRRPSTMRGVSLLRTLRLRAYRERRPPSSPLLPPSLASPGIATCLNVSASSAAALAPGLSRSFTNRIIFMKERANEKNLNER